MGEKEAHRKALEAERASAESASRRESERARKDREERRELVRELRNCIKLLGRGPQSTKLSTVPQPPLECKSYKADVVKADLETMAVSKNFASGVRRIIANNPSNTLRVRDGTVYLNGGAMSDDVIRETLAEHRRLLRRLLQECIEDGASSLMESKSCLLSQELITNLHAQPKSSEVELMEFKIAV